MLRLDGPLKVEGSSSVVGEVQWKGWGIIANCNIFTAHQPILYVFRVFMTSGFHRP